MITFARGQSATTMGIFATSGNGIFPSIVSIATTTILLSILHLHLQSAAGHGYLATPRSRNLYAHDKTNWSSFHSNNNPSSASDDPMPETCPQCLSTPSPGGCGITNKEKHNYDHPKNALGGPMGMNIQAVYEQGQEIVVEVVLTAHHKGHFVFSGCPLSSAEEVATQACFDKYPLTFVKDMKHGANLDVNYPERAYVAPDTFKDRLYSFKMQLPSDLHGDLVLIQWHYLTANSCIHEGYTEYNWPESWDYGFNTGAFIPEPCFYGLWGDAEQFWNCAEVTIQQSRNINHSSSNNNHSTINSKQQSGNKKKNGNNKKNDINNGIKYAMNKKKNKRQKNKRDNDVNNSINHAINNKRDKNPNSKPDRIKKPSGYRKNKPNRKEQREHRMKQRMSPRRKDQENKLLKERRTK